MQRIPFNTVFKKLNYTDMNVIKKNSYAIVFACVVLICSCTMNKSKKQTPKYVQQIDSVLQIAYNNELFNGNVLIVKNDTVVYEKSFGFTNAYQDTPLNDKSIFNIGSIAKEFNGVAIMMLVEQGKLSLDDTIDTFDLNLPDWSKKITVKHLLNYASGLPKMLNDITNDAIAFNKVHAIDSLLFEPGTDFNYNNYSVFLQRRIVEKVTHQTFQDFVTERMLKPLHLEQAVFDPKPNYSHRTSCYDLDKQACPKFEFISGWVWLTANDLNTWIRAMNTNQLISQESFDIALRNPYVAKRTSSLGEYFEEQQLQRHNGTGWSYRSLMLNDFKNKITIILLDNSAGLATELGHVVHNIILKKDFELPKQSVYQKLRKTFVDDVDKGIVVYNTLKKNQEAYYAFESPNEITRLGYAVLREGKIEAAIKTFVFGISKFPNHANLYDSLAEAFLTAEDYDKALKNYKKAIALGGTNGNAKKMIERIKKINN